MVEAWVVLLLYGGGVMDDLPLLDRRGVRRHFCWLRVPNPTTFGRWLRRAAGRMIPLLDALLWYMVRRRWTLSGGTPRGLTVVVDRGGNALLWSLAVVASRRCTRCARTIFPGPGGRRSPSGSASGSSGCPQS